MTGTLFDRADRALGAAMRAALVVLLFALFMVVVWIVFNRLTGLAATGWTDELVELLFAWVLFVGAASLWRERKHFAVDLLGVRWKGTARGAWLGVAVSILSIVFLVLFVWQSWIFTISASDASPIFQVSKAYWHGSMPVCGLIMLAYAIRDLVLSVQRVRHWSELPPPNPETASGADSH